MIETDLNSGIVESEQSRLNLYGEILRKEATSLLAQYLPEALPQEPTEVLFDIAPAYLGKFKGKHYIMAEKMVVGSSNQQKQMEELTKRQQELMRRFEEEMEEFLRLLKENAEKGIDDEDLANKVFSSSGTEPIPQPEKEDWEEPERLEGPSQYSLDTWRGIYTLVHELIHQKQAELNPEAFPVLASPELDNTDPSSISRNELKRLLISAHKVQSRSVDNNSLFYPVIEGIAVLGSFYVMSKFLADLKNKDQDELMKKVNEVRNEGIRLELAKKQEGYDSNYLEGSRLIRKIYKQFGIENTPRLLSQVNLQACQVISKDTPQYQQVLENPALLPGLQQAA